MRGLPAEVVGSGVTGTFVGGLRVGICLSGGLRPSVVAASAWYRVVLAPAGGNKDLHK